MCLQCASLYLFAPSLYSSLALSNSRWLLVVSLVVSYALGDSGRRGPSFTQRGLPSTPPVPRSGRASHTARSTISAPPCPTLFSFQAGLEVSLLRPIRPRALTSHPAAPGNNPRLAKQTETTNSYACLSLFIHCSIQLAVASSCFLGCCLLSRRLRLGPSCTQRGLPYHLNAPCPTLFSFQAGLEVSLQMPVRPRAFTSHPAARAIIPAWQNKLKTTLMCLQCASLYIFVPLSIHPLLYPTRGGFWSFPWLCPTL